MAGPSDSNFELAMRNFMQNQLLKGGADTGSALAGSHVFQGFLGQMKFPSLEDMHKNVGRVPEKFAKLLEAFKYISETLSPQSLGIFGQLTKMPQGIVNSDSKIYTLSSPGRGK